MNDTSPNGQPDPRPYISKLEVSGFKSIRHAELELGRLNVLIGANGSGKSNLGSLLRLLRAYADRSFPTFVAISGGANSLLYFGAKRTPRIELAFTTNRLLATDSGFVFEYGDNDQLVVVEKGTDSELEWPNIERMLFDLGVYHFNDTSREARLRQTGDVDEDYQLHGSGRNLAAFLYKLQEVHPKHFEFLTKVVRLVAPFFDRFKLRPNELNARTINLRWREVGADEDFGVHLLSDGTLRFIALAALLTQPKEKLPSLIFIDEPEIGLHPAALTHIAGLIKTAALHTQVILATQSVEMLEHFEPGDVIVTERRNGATEFKRLDPSKLTEWLEDYSLGELWLKNVIGGRITR